MKPKQCPYCQKFLTINPRVRKQRKTCGSSSCQKALNRENSARWRQEHPNHCHPPITLGSNSGSKSIQLTSNATEKTTPPILRRIARPSDSGIDGKSSVLIYKTRLKTNLLKSLINYGIHPILIYKMSLSFNPLK